MSFDVATSLRRLKPDKKLGPLNRRPEAQLPWIEDAPATGSGLLLDTTFYIDALQDRRPHFREQLLGRRAITHSAVALAELAHPLGRLDPRHPGTPAAVGAIAAVIKDMTRRAIVTPSARAMGEAGIIAGIVARLRGATAVQLQPLLNDAILFCQATEEGLTLLTRNVIDFDAIQQVAGGGRLLFYRQSP